jgi:hypothetical protein
MKYENYKREKEPHAENAMIRAGSWKLLQALARYHYARAKCPKRKDAWARIGNIKAPKTRMKGGRKPVPLAVLEKARLSVVAIAAENGYTSAQLFGKDRDPVLMSVRVICYWHLFKAGMSYKDIGRVMARDHSTVIYGIRKMAA